MDRLTSGCSLIQKHHLNYCRTCGRMEQSSSNCVKGAGVLLYEYPVLHMPVCVPVAHDSTQFTLRLPTTQV